MTKKQKIASLDGAMTRSTREDGTDYYHFTDDAPKSLVDTYLEHFEVREVDYETFNDACDIMAEAYSDKDRGEHEFDDYIMEQADDAPSVYNACLLEYIDIWNQDEISVLVRDYNIDICQAAGCWYSEQVREGCEIIRRWI